MLRFEGDRDFGLAPAEAGARLSDARFLVHCIPDAESIKETVPQTTGLPLNVTFPFAVVLPPPQPESPERATRRTIATDDRSTCLGRNMAINSGWMFGK